jgi:hypothetical protein
MPRVLQIFLSCASEDAGLALALSKALKGTQEKEGFLDKDFSQVWLDTEELRAGLDLTQQISNQLDKTDILIIVYTGQQTDSHGFTGIEVGYFMRTMKMDDGPIERRIVTFYSDSLPDATANLKGIPLYITKATLAQSSESYKNSLQSLSINNPIALFLKDLEELINTLRKEAGFNDNAYDDNKRLQSVRDLLLECFEALKKRK